MSIIKVENLCCTYGEKTSFEQKAVKNVSFEIERGDFVGLIGHTGSGKSTLVQMLNGLIKPTSGKVYLEDKDIHENPKEIRSVRFKVGLVFQYPEYQLFEETVYKDIAFGPTNMDPDILILDEPTAGLDPVGRNVLLSQISQYQKSRNNTVILVSHSMEDVARVTKKVMVMNKGELVLYDKTEKVFSQGDKLMSMGLKVPSGILTVDRAVHEITELLKKEGKL